jgi:transposase
MGQVTVISGIERRRRWNEEERLQILAEAFSPGACVSAVARRHDVSTALIYTWRRKVCQARGEPSPAASLGPGFAEAVVRETEEVAQPETRPAIVVDLAGGRRVSIFAPAPTGLVTAALRALR